MKTKHTLKSVIQMLFILTLLFQSIQSTAAVQISKKDNDIIVSTTRKAVEGYKGCEKNDLKKVSAYIYTLYKKGEKQDNNESCSLPQPWKKISTKDSNNSEEIFKNLPDGEYKAVVYVASPIGCDIEGNSQKSIIYLKDKSGIVSFKSNEKTELKESSPSNSSAKINSNDLEVFPIPTKDKLTVKLSNSKLVSSANMTFYDLQGKLVLENTYNIGNGNQLEWNIDVSTFSSGTYLLRVDDSFGNSYTKKIVVIKD